MSNDDWTITCHYELLCRCKISDFLRDLLTFIARTPHNKNGLFFTKEDHVICFSWISYRLTMRMVPFNTMHFIRKLLFWMNKCDKNDDLHYKYICSHIVTKFGNRTFLTATGVCQFLTYGINVAFIAIKPESCGIYVGRERTRSELAYWSKCRIISHMSTDCSHYGRSLPFWCTKDGFQTQCGPFISVLALTGMYSAVLRHPYVLK